MGGVPSSWQPNSSLSVSNLAPVNVNAVTMGSSPMMGNLYGNGGMSGAPNMGSGGGAGNVPVKDLAPVHVNAQMPVQPNMFDRYMGWSNDHPFLSGLAENAVGGVTGLAPVIVAAHAYYNAQHNQPIFGSLSDLASKAGHALGGLGSLGGMFSGPGSPLSANSNSPVFGDLYSSQSTGMATGLGGNPQHPQSGSSGYTIASSGGALPYYPGLSSLGNGGPAPMGGFWNQQAIHDAAPTYGPYAGMSGSTPPATPPLSPYAPSGITAQGW